MKLNEQHNVKSDPCPYCKHKHSEEPAECAMYLSHKYGLAKQADSYDNTKNRMQYVDRIEDLKKYYKKFFPKYYSHLLATDFRIYEEDKKKKFFLPNYNPPPREITKQLAMSVGNKIGVDWNVITLEEFRKGMQEELEHKDVTGGMPLATGKIAHAHLKEDPKYYTKLKSVMEMKLVKILKKGLKNKYILTNAQPRLSEGLWRIFCLETKDEKFVPQNKLKNYNLVPKV